MFNLQLFLRVLLGGCGCLRPPQGLKPSPAGMPPVSAVPGMWLPMTTAREVFGESSHGGCRTGAPCPGGVASRGEQNEAENKRKQLISIPLRAGFKAPNTLGVEAETRTGSMQKNFMTLLEICTAMLQKINLAEI